MTLDDILKKLQRGREISDNITKKTGDVLNSVGWGLAENIVKPITKATYKTIDNYSARKKALEEKNPNMSPLDKYIEIKKDTEIDNINNLVGYANKKVNDVLSYSDKKADELAKNNILRGILLGANKKVNNEQAARNIIKGSIIPNDFKLEENKFKLKDTIDERKYKSFTNKELQNVLDSNADEVAPNKLARGIGNLAYEGAKMYASTKLSPMLVYGTTGALEEYGRTDDDPDKIIASGLKDATYGTIMRGTSNLAKTGMTKVLPNVGKKWLPTVVANYGSNYAGGFGASALTDVGYDLITGEKTDPKQILENANKSGLMSGIIGGTTDIIRDAKLSKIRFNKDVNSAIENLQNINKQITEGDVSISKNPKIINKLLEKGNKEIETLSNNNYLMKNNKIKETIDMLKKAYDTGHINDIKIANNNFIGLLGTAEMNLKSNTQNNNIAPVKFENNDVSTFIKRKNNIPISEEVQLKNDLANFSKQIDNIDDGIIKKYRDNPPRLQSPNDTISTINNIIPSRNNYVNNAKNSQENVKVDNLNKNKTAIPISEEIQIKGDIENFSKQVDNVKNGTFPKRDMLTLLSNTPKVLQDIGLSNYPITMTQRHLDTIMNADGKYKNANYHNLGEDIVKQLPKAIANPLDIVHSNTAKNSIVLTTYLADKNNNTVVASIKIDGKGFINDIVIDTNVMTSAYGRKNYDKFMQDNIKKGNLLYDVDQGIIKKLSEQGFNYLDDSTSKEASPVQQLTGYTSTINNIIPRGENYVNNSENNQKSVKKIQNDDINTFIKEENNQMQNSLFELKKVVPIKEKTKTAIPIAKNIKEMSNLTNNNSIDYNISESIGDKNGRQRESDSRSIRKTKEYNERRGSKSNITNFKREGIDSRYGKDNISQKAIDEVLKDKNAKKNVIEYAKRNNINKLSTDLLKLNKEAQKLGINLVLFNGKNGNEYIGLMKENEMYLDLNENNLYLEDGTLKDRFYHEVFHYLKRNTSFDNEIKEIQYNILKNNKETINRYIEKKGYNVDDFSEEVKAIITEEILADYCAKHISGYDVDYGLPEEITYSLNQIIEDALVELKLNKGNIIKKDNGNDIKSFVKRQKISIPISEETKSVKRPNIIDEKVAEYIKSVKDNFESDIDISTKVVNDSNAVPIDYKNEKQVTIYKRARDIFAKIRKKVFTNKNDGEKIYVSNTDINESIRKTMTNLDQKRYLDENMAVFSQLDKIIENGKEISGSIEDTKGREYKDYKYYVSNVYIDEEPFVVEFDTRVQLNADKPERHFRLERVYKVNEGDLVTGLSNNIPDQFVPKSPSINNIIPKDNKYVNSTENSQKSTKIDKNNSNEEFISPTIDKISENRTKNKVKASELKDLLAQKLVNKGHTVDKLAKATNNPSLTHAYDRILSAFAEGNYSIGKAQTNNKGEEIGKSIKDIFKPAEDNKVFKEFNDYLLNRHNIDRLAVEKNLYSEDITPENSRKTIKEYEEKHPEFKEWAEDVYKFNRNELQNLVDAGFIDKNSQEYLTNLYGRYVPAFRDIIGTAKSLEDKTTGAKNPIKTAKGGTEKILNIKDAMAEQVIKTKKAIRMNELGLELAKSLGEKSVLDPNVEITYSAEAIMSLEGNVVTYEGDKPIFTVFKDGQAKELVIGDDLYDSLKKDTIISKIQNSKLNMIAEPISKVSRFYRNLLTTYNIGFAFTNAIKDFQDSFFNTKFDPITYGKNYIKALYQIGTNGEYHKLYLANGGGMNTYFEYGKGVLKDTKNLVKKFIQKIQKINEIIEEAPRLAELMSTLEKGGTISEGMYNAADVTTNFKRGGEVAKAIDSYGGASFFNVSVQSLDKTYRTFKGEKGWKGYAKLLMKAVMFSVMPSVLNYLLLRGDEEYEALPSYIKDEYYLFKKDNGKFVRIPKGRIISVIGSTARRFLEASEGKGFDLEGLKNTAKKQLAPNNPFEDNIFAPIKAVKTNKAWHSGDIVPSRLQKQLPKNQYDEKTDEISKWLGSIFNYSPKKINYLLDQYSGGIGDVVLPMFTPQAENNILEDKFTTDSVLKNKYVGEFYDKKDELEKINNDISKTYQDEVKYKYLNSISEKIGKLYNQKRDVQMSNISDREKKETVRDIQKEINWYAENALKNVNGNMTEEQEWDMYIEGIFSDKIRTEDKSSNSLDAQYAVDNGLCTKREYIDLYKKTKENKQDMPTIKYLKKMEEIGLDIENYVEYKINTKGLKSDKDEKGKAINASLNEKEAKVIMNMNISDKQKDLLFDITNKTDVKPTMSDLKKLNGDYLTYLQQSGKKDNNGVSQRDKYMMYVDTGIPVKTLNKYYDEIGKIEGVKDKNGKTISGSKKRAIFKYINSLPLSVTKKKILFTKSNSSYGKSYKREIFNYINKLPISKARKEQIWKELYD